MNGIKFKISSDYLKHSIELFRLKYEDFFSCVSRFHLPCVRGFYCGDNVHLLPSCIGALMTNLNIDYKYFAGIRNPIDILNKYRGRGFGTILNSNEKLYLINYNAKHEEMKDIFGIKLKDVKTINAHFGPTTVKDKIHRLKHYLEGLPVDIYSDINPEYILTKEDLKDAYKTLYGYDEKESRVGFLGFKTISPEGRINPLEKWIIDAGAHLLVNKD